MEQWMGRRKNKARGRVSRSGRGDRKRVQEWERCSSPLQRKIAKALSHDGYLSALAAHEAAFHMTDWIADLEELNKLFASPRWNNARARSVIMQFVIHAPHHLAAACRIIMDYPVQDILQLGAVTGTGCPKRKPGGPY